MNTYFAVDLFRTLYMKRKTIGRPAHPHLESFRRPRDYKGTYGRKKALQALYNGLHIKTKTTKKRRN